MTACSMFRMVMFLTPEAYSKAEETLLWGVQRLRRTNIGGTA